MKAPNSGKKRVTAKSSRQSLASSPGSRYKTRNGHSQKSKSVFEGCHKFDPFDTLYSNWDLVPTCPEKYYPNWDSYKSIPDAMAQLSRDTVQRLTRHGVVENMPTTPSPRDIAILNILQKKLIEWEKAEEDLFRRHKGWYCENKSIRDRAYVSWVRTQNRNFGSAVWRWLKLDDWKRTQTPRMKGLWHQAVYGRPCTMTSYGRRLG